MSRVGEFKKVSYEQFLNDFDREIHIGPDMIAQYGDEEIKNIYDNIQLPKRATAGSAGYDFKAPMAITIYPGDSLKIPTGIRVKIADGWFLGCLPRSGLGFKYHVKLANTMGVIDADYYNSSNEGHIFLKLVNTGNKIISINAGESFAQGIFIPFGITYSDDCTEKRDGGFGSTDKK